MSRCQLVLWRLLIAVVFLAAWEIASHWVGTFWISHPTAIVKRLADWTVTGTLLRHTLATLVEVAIGYAAGAAAGIVAGFVLGRRPLLDDAVRPTVAALYSLPKVALAPLFVMWFGIGLSSKIALVAVTVFFIVFYNTHAGVHAIDPSLIRSVQLFGAGPLRIFRSVVIPGAFRYILTGLRVAVRSALIAAVVGEIVAGNQGIGYLIEASAGDLDVGGVLASVVLLVAIGLFINLVISVAERTASWSGGKRAGQPAQRAA